MWAQLVTVALGIWLMAAPAVLGFGGVARKNHLIVGPVVAALAWIAASECTRGLRRANLMLAAWLMVAPLAIDHEFASAWNSVAVGAAVALFSSRGGDTTGRFGDGWGALWRRRQRADPGR